MIWNRHTVMVVLFLLGAMPAHAGAPLFIREGDALLLPPPADTPVYVYEVTWPEGSSWKPWEVGKQVAEDFRREVRPEPFTVESMDEQSAGVANNFSGHDLNTLRHIEQGHIGFGRRGGLLGNITSNRSPLTTISVTFSVASVPGAEAETVSAKAGTAMRPVQTDVILSSWRGGGASTHRFGGTAKTNFRLNYFCGGQVTNNRFGNGGRRVCPNY